MELPMRLNKKTRGFSLLEFLIYIAIISLGLYLVFGRGQAARSDNQANNVQSELGLYVTAVPKARQSLDFTGITAAEICKYLTEQSCPGGVITHSGAGTSTVSAVTIGGLSHVQFVVTNISAKACSSALATLHPSLAELSVGSTVIKSSTVQFTESALNAACSQPTQTVTFATRG
jgi:Tfp pilus assembly protein FimT